MNSIWKLHIFQFLFSSRFGHLSVSDDYFCLHGFASIVSNKKLSLFVVSWPVGRKTDTQGKPLCRTDSLNPGMLYATWVTRRWNNSLGGTGHFEKNIDVIDKEVRFSYPLVSSTLVLFRHLNESASSSATLSYPLDGTPMIKFRLVECAWHGKSCAHGIGFEKTRNWIRCSHVFRNRPADW
jgi:hypothetical protein